MRPLGPALLLLLAASVALAGTDEVLVRVHAPEWFGGEPLVLREDGSVAPLAGGASAHEAVAGVAPGEALRIACRPWEGVSCVAWDVRAPARGALDVALHVSPPLFEGFPIDAEFRAVGASEASLDVEPGETLVGRAVAIAAAVPGTGRVAVLDRSGAVLQAWTVASERPLAATWTPTGPGPHLVVLHAGDLRVVEVVNAWPAPRVFAAGASLSRGLDAGDAALLEVAGFDGDRFTVEIVQGPVRWEAARDHEGRGTGARAVTVSPEVATLGPTVVFPVVALGGARVAAWVNGTVAGEARSVPIAWRPEPVEGPLLRIVSPRGPLFDEDAIRFFALGFGGDVRVTSSTLPLDTVRRAEDGFVSFEVPARNVTEGTHAVRAQGISPAGEPVETAQALEIVLYEPAPPRDMPAGAVALVALAAAALLARPRRG